MQSLHERPTLLNDIKIESNGGFELGMEIVIKASLKGYKITEVPSIWRGRGTGESRFRLWKWSPKYMHWYLYAVRGKFIFDIRNLPLIIIFFS